MDTKQTAQTNQTQLTVDAAYTHAVEHFNAERYTEADQLCTAIIKAVPNHIDAINLLGIIAQKLNRHDLAVEQFQRAIKIDNSRALLYFNLGTSIYPLGRREEAIKVLKIALKKEPGNVQITEYLNSILSHQTPDSKPDNTREKVQELLQRGVSCHQSGRIDEAVQWYRKVLEIDPENTAALNNIGIAMQEQGKLDEAVICYNQAISIRPDYVEAHSNLGAALNELGKIDESVVSCKKALSIDPNYNKAHTNLGNALKEQGKLDEAVISYQKAISIEPDYAEPHSNLGSTLHDLGKLDEAVISYQKAISINPNYTEAYYNLGNALQEKGKLEEAVTSYQKAISINPGYAKAHCNFGDALKEQGKLEEAVASYQKAISINPENGMYWAGFAQCVKNLSFTHCSDDFFHYLLQLLDQPTVRPHDVSGAVIRALRHHPQFSNVLSAAKSANLEQKIGDYTVRLSAIPLLLRMMELSVIVDVDVEEMLTQMRSVMLNNLTTKNTEVQSLPFYAALALHCFTNEYIFTESGEEKQKIEHLQEKIKNILYNGESAPSYWIAVLGAYRPLHSFSWSDKLLECEWSHDIGKVIERQVKEPKKEQELRFQIERLASIRDTVSKAVRDQYEENPYPRWVSTCLSDRPKAIAQVLQEIKLPLDFNAQQFSPNPDILIAGCGTGQHSLRTASRFMNCNVLAFDLSLSSLSYAVRKTQELGIANIEFMQGDILQLNNLERSFDIIESVGVLHHMNDPIAGWQILVDILRANGVMKIGLYSDIARQHIVEARRLIAEKKYKTSSDDIRRYRSEIINMTDDANAGMVKILNSRDFYSMSTCRDLLFHVQEHRFTLPQVEMVLQDLGLRFIGFEMQQNQVMQKFIKLFPEKDASVSLSLWNKFELQHPDTFVGMYQFWVQKI
jgi:tetratricopeptide (TPR) repeat protein